MEEFAEGDPMSGRAAESAKNQDTPQTPQSDSAPEPAPNQRSEPTAAARRSLRELFAAVREQDNSAEPKLTRMRASTSKRRKREKPAQNPVMPAPEPPRTPAMVFHPRAALSQAGPRKRSKLPRWQRWKERRLPLVCWDRR
jgi:hypothetical protein